MLNELHIENIAVIERADIQFTAGFNVLTGETGAGKSIVIDAIGAVLGDRVNRDLVRRGADKGLVTAVFDAEGVQDWLEKNDIEADGELILQRRIGADGKSSARVCGLPVTAAQMKELASLLVDIHGQNDGRQLMDERLHMTYLDRFGSYTDELASYAGEYDKYRALKQEIAKLSMDELEKERLSDSLQAQIKELESAELRPGEEEELNARRDLLRNAEKLTEAIDEACTALDEGDASAQSMTQNAAYYAQRAAAIAPELDSAAKAIRDAAFLLTDAGETLRDFRDSLDFSPLHILSGRMREKVCLTIWMSAGRSSMRSSMPTNGCRSSSRSFLIRTDAAGRPVCVCVKPERRLRVSWKRGSSQSFAI